MCQRLDHELRDCLEAKARKRDALKEKEEAKERLEVQPAGERHRQNREVNFRTSGAREYDRRRPSEIENYSRRGRDSQERNKYPPRHHPYARSMRDNSRDRGSQQHSSFFQRHVQTNYQPRDQNSHQNSQERVHKPISNDTNSQEQGSDRNARSTRSLGFGSHREGNEPSTEPARNRAELSPLEETRTDGNPEPPTKRKPGRPPGKRRTQESPLKLTGPLAAKRRVS
ncbi:hypothetical protein HID58_066280 [Brassica napus]|uniref:Uncharacterized protein n=1 Tax=Brassica napus TaxID=3708 RepID=A0ABQ7ZFQ0_BRANA|nr:hypothetical protein HID58_066280 [Brassica napus]